MKKFLLFLTLFLSAVGLASAEVALPASGNTWASYKWSDSNKYDYQCSDLEGYTFFLEGNSNSGKQPDATDMRIYAGGKLTITAPKGKKFTKITVKIASGSAATGVTTNAASTWTLSGQVTTTANRTFSLEATTGQSSITFWGVQGTSSTTKKMFIKSVTVTEVDDTPSTPTDCGIAFTAASGEVTYPGTGYVLPFKNDNKVDVTFTSTEADVATVANKSNMPDLTIVGCGKTTITASFAGNTTYEAKEVSFDLTVNQGTPALSFAKTSYTANLGEAFDLPELAGVPDGATISWTSTATDVAEFVDGVLNIKAAGATTIKATTSATDLYTEGNASFSLNVVDPNNTTIALVFGDVENSLVTHNKAIDEIQYNGITFAFVQGGHSQLAPVYDNSDKTARVYKQNEFTITLPTGYTFEKIEFTSSDTSIKNLLVGSESDGSLTITESTKSALWTPAATFVSNSVTFKGNTSATTRIASITVYMKAPLADDDAGLAFANATDNATYKTPYTLQTLTNPKGVEVTWSSSNTEVADFNEDGTINIKKAGETTIKATATDAKYTVNNSASYTLTIAKGDPADFAYAKPTYDYVMGENFSAPTLKIPEGLTVASYLSSDTEVATVNDEGVITPVSRGTAVITAHTDGNDCWNAKDAKLTINITKKIPTLSFKDTEVSLFVEEATSYAGQTLKVTPNDLTVTYALNNDEATIGTIEAETGKLVLNGIVGTATVTATTTETSVYESRSASYTIEVKKHVTELSFAQAEVEVKLGEKYAGQTASCTIEESLKEGFTITYASDNEAVATVDANTGAVTLTNAEGTATITATASGNTYYTPATASYTITVKKAKVAYLVTDASVLQPGDIIIIANQEYGKAISTETKTDNRPATAVTFNSDKSEIVSIGSDVMLFQLKQWSDSDGTFWMLYTTNYTDTNGALYSSSSSSTLKIGTPKNNYFDAVITIDQETGEANIAFNKGASSGTNIMRYNSTSDLFNCYTATNSQKPVYIYRVTDKPATVVDQAPGFNFAAKGEKENLNVIVLDNIIETSTTAEKVAIYLDNVLVGTYPVQVGMVEAKFDYIPYLPTAKFTMRPVLKEEGGVPTQVGPAEALRFTWPALDDENHFTYGKEDEKIFCVNEDSAEGPWILYGQFFFVDVFEKGNLDYRVSVKAVNNADDSEYTDAEFSWGNGGFYVSIPNFITATSLTVAGKPDISKCTVPVVKFIATPSYEFTYDTKYSSLVTTAAGAPARLKAPGTTATQTITCAPQEIAISNLTNETEVSGVEGVTVDGGAAVEYFNLQGVRVDGDLAPGIYIRRQGQSVSKVRIN